MAGTNNMEVRMIIDYYHIDETKGKQNSNKRNFIINWRSLSHANKQWGATQRLKSVSFPMITPKATSQKRLKKTQKRGRKRDRSGWLKEISSFL